MTSPSDLHSDQPAFGPGSAVHSEADLEDLWRGVVTAGASSQQTLWIAFLDPGQVLSPTLVPIEGFPAEPESAGLSGLREMIGTVVGSGACRASGSVALMIERSGVEVMTEPDRAWARALRGALGDLCRWPCFLATPGGVVVFAPDDLIDS